jgi:hypothetical protein
MRDKLNNNPMAQVGAVVLLLIVAFVFFTRMSGGESEEAAPTEATVSVEGTGATGTATGATPGETVEGAVSQALESETGAVAVPSVAQVVPPPLPKPVEAAYLGGKTVALLVVHDGGIDDRLVTRSTKQLESFPNTAVFIVPAKQIARYGAITLGVEVQQVPALIVLRPERLSEGVPQGTVSYGFQTRAGIAQAMRDAVYDGPETTYSPG